MKTPVTVRIFDIVGGPLCVSADDGQRVYDKIVPLLRDGTPVVLSFEQVETVLKRVVDNAKTYFKASKKFDLAWKEEVGDEE